MVVPRDEEGVIEHIYTSHWRNPELGDLGATIISISRGEPRWRLPFSYRRLRELAPDNETWRHDDPAEFERAYVRQLEALGAVEILQRIERVAVGKPVILLCWEKPGDLCHRRTLAAWIETEAGIVVPELVPGMIETKPEAQPALFGREE